MRALLDSTALIDFLRGDERARTFIRSMTLRPYLSAMTVAELYRSIREGREKQLLADAVAFFEVVPVDDLVAEKGGLWGRQFGPSHGVGLADALIAACADVVSAQLVTHNRRHFPMLAEVLVPYGG